MSSEVEQRHTITTIFKMWKTSLGKETVVFELGVLLSVEPKIDDMFKRVFELFFTNEAQKRREVVHDSYEIKIELKSNRNRIEIESKSNRIEIESKSQSK